MIECREIDSGHLGDFVQSAFTRRNPPIPKPSPPDLRRKQSAPFMIPVLAALSQLSLFDHSTLTLLLNFQEIRPQNRLFCGIMRLTDHFPPPLRGGEGEVCGNPPSWLVIRILPLRPVHGAVRHNTFAPEQNTLVLNQNNVAMTQNKVAERQNNVAMEQNKVAERQNKVALERNNAALRHKREKSRDYALDG